MVELSLFAMSVEAASVRNDIAVVETQEKVLPGSAIYMILMAFHRKNHTCLTLVIHEQI